MKEAPISTISSKRKSFFERWTQIKNYREVLYVLAYKDIKTKYAQTTVGLLWSFVNPVVTAIVITFVFKKVGVVKTFGMPHTLFTMTGMIGWMYISNVIQSSGSSLVSNQELIKRTFFPRIFIPISKALSAMLNFLILFICVFILMVIYRIAPTGNIIYLPLFIMMAVVTGFGIGVWVCAISIRFRDLIQAVPILLRLGMFITPIGYSWREINGMDGWIRFFYFFNPVAGVVESIRWSILDAYRFHPYIYISFGISFLLLFTGLKYFEHVEYKMADLI